MNSFRNGLQWGFQIGIVMLGLSIIITGVYFHLTDVISAGIETGLLMTCGNLMLVLFRWCVE